MDQKKINEILKKHARWLRNEPRGERADLREEDLREADLRGANLCWADIYGADLYEADLREADLRNTDLRRANLRGANLSGADLCGADLCGADLWGANLHEVDLRKAQFREKDIRSAVNIPYIPMACPDSGLFVAWKKAFSVSGNVYLVKLLIPEDARRSSATGRKCRADKAEVLAIEPIESVSVIADKVFSKYDPDFYYQVGQCITVPDFDTDRFNECAPGIHFFINRQEAIDYEF